MDIQNNNTNRKLTKFEIAINGSDEDKLNYLNNTITNSNTRKYIEAIKKDFESRGVEISGRFRHYEIATSKSTEHVESVESDVKNDEIDGKEFKYDENDVKNDEKTGKKDVECEKILELNEKLDEITKITSVENNEMKQDINRILKDFVKNNVNGKEILKNIFKRTKPNGKSFSLQINGFTIYYYPDNSISQTFKIFNSMETKERYKTKRGDITVKIPNENKTILYDSNKLCLLIEQYINNQASTGMKNRFKLTGIDRSNIISIIDTIIRRITNVSHGIDKIEEIPNNATKEKRKLIDRLNSLNLH